MNVNIEETSNRTYNFWINKWVKNAVENALKIKCSSSFVEYIKENKNLTKKKKCVIINCGESSHNYVKEIKENRNKIFLISPFQSLNGLLKCNIVPDLIVLYDCGVSLIKEIDDICTLDLNLICNTCAYPKIVNSWEGNIYFFNMYNPKYEFTTKGLKKCFPHIDSIINVGSVSNLSLIIAYNMNFQEIIVLGNDLGYKDFYRSKTTKWYNDMAMDGNKFNNIETINKVEMSKTNNEYSNAKVYKFVYEKLIKQIKRQNKDIKIYDLSYKDYEGTMKKDFKKIILNKRK